MAETPRYAHFVALLFLGSMFLILVCALIAIVAAISKARRVANLASAGAAIVAASYAALLFGVALTSSNTTLSPGDRKYFCEADCHIAYTIDSVRDAATLGSETKPISARGRFLVVRLKTWFDQHSIAPFRGNDPLTPNPRGVSVMDNRGRYFFPVTQAAAALGADSAPLNRPLGPGESYFTTFVFDLPADSRDAKLLISDVDPITRLLVGHENSPLHGKIYLSLQPGSSSASGTQ